MDYYSNLTLWIQLCTQRASRVSVPNRSLCVAVCNWHFLLILLLILLHQISAALLPDVQNLSSPNSHCQNLHAAQKLLTSKTALPTQSSMITLF